MAKVELKKPVVEEISNSIKDAAAVVLVNYKGINVEQDTQMRKELREAGVVYKVYKNTMMNFAFKGTACEELCQHLEGTNACLLYTSWKSLTTTDSALWKPCSPLCSAISLWAVRQLLCIRCIQKRRWKSVRP